ncbi:MAG: tRNA 2-thiouridine(34) synthase MnmA [bacterium]
MITQTHEFQKEYQEFLEEVYNNLTELQVPQKATIAVGLSGGVDSASTLAILRELGYNTIAVTMKIWNPKYEHLITTNGKLHGCFGPEEIQDIQDIKLITQKLKTPLYVIDLSEEYDQTILSYFKREYLLGRTPNPCVMCNWKMKFEYLLEGLKQLKVEFDYFATGHYVKRTIFQNYHTLSKAKYIQKDQTYYLSFLNQNHIKKSIFPLGLIKSKDLTRQIAQKYDLPVYNKPDSQNFISTKYIEIFKGVEIKDGIIQHKNGKILGKHKGIHLYTIGQRKGLNISYPNPLYVINIDSQTNTITVGEKEDLYQSKLIAKNPNWIVPFQELPPNTQILGKIRYTHQENPCSVKLNSGNTLEVEFTEKQMAITPGQIIAFYVDQTLIGSAIIEKIILS